MPKKIEAPQPAKMGRKAYPPELKKRPRSVALTDSQWEKLRGLGTEWLIRRIELAKDPA